MTDHYKILRECQDSAFDLIKHITGETDREQGYRHSNDTKYKMVIQHITDLYYMIKTNKAFQQEQKELELKMHELINQMEKEPLTMADFKKNGGE